MNASNSVLLETSCGRAFCSLPLCRTPSLHGEKTTETNNNGYRRNRKNKKNVHHTLLVCAILLHACCLFAFSKTMHKKREKIITYFLISLYFTKTIASLKGQDRDEHRTNKGLQEKMNGICIDYTMWKKS
jgi:hypothetical protein